MGGVSLLISFSQLSHTDFTFFIRNSTYTFSPVTGLIHIHTIDSIHPAPHQAAFDALRSSLERVLGLAGGGVAQPTGEVTRTEEVQVGVGGDDDGVNRRSRGRG
jgi:hypothetical protein